MPGGIAQAVVEADVVCGIAARRVAICGGRVARRVRAGYRAVRDIACCISDGCIGHVDRGVSDMSLGEQQRKEIDCRRRRF